LAAIVVDKAASLYTANCANCHGAGIDVPAGTDLHKVIAAGTHEGMPSWGGDLSTDEIDALRAYPLPGATQPVRKELLHAMNKSLLARESDRVTARIR
jgi:mono/diheme cytochrome c family protein